MSNTFRFKQFEVVQHQSAMKVNTDGVLLGAWAIEASEGFPVKTMLDIGTGTGVIALMLAQAYRLAIIDAIDIDKDAFAEAAENFAASHWSSRLNAYNTPLQNYVPGRLYDLIISNPPYFIDDFKTGSEKRNLAKHSAGLTYEELLSGINRLLAPEGKAFVVIPVFNVDRLQSLATAEHLFITQLTEVIATAGKPAYLALLRLERNPKAVVKAELTIQTAPNQFTEVYKELTKEFYLKF